MKESWMIRHHVRCVVVLGVVLASSLAVADTVSKEACIDAHSRGQDAKESGKLSLARKLFQTCSQPSCPGAVQGDCARFADDLSRMQSSLSFAARDGSGNDLPDTSVYIDDVLIVTRLDDGKPHDVDPGKHVIKFQHDTKEQIVTIVVGTGEKGRTVSATFGSPAKSGGDKRDSQPARRESRVERPMGAKALLGVGTAMVAAGAGLAVIGMLRIPSNCSLSTHQCAAPPSDPSFDDAASAVGMANIGFVVGGLGLAAVVGGAVWYVKGGKPSDERLIAAPWLGPDGGGVAAAGRF
jgi:hypothetical protein